MSGYVPQVGHRVRLPLWPRSHYLDVLFVGETVVVGTNSQGNEAVRNRGEDWQRVRVLGAMWLNVYPDGSVGKFGDRSSAEQYACPGRIACLRLYQPSPGADFAVGTEWLDEQ